MKWSELKSVVILLLALTLFAVPASACSAERTFSTISVIPNQEFKVTVNVADYGAAGQLLEKLPSGFTLVSSTLPERAVTVNGSEVSFLFMTEKNFSYILKAPATTGTYKIVGLFRDINKTEFPVSPADCSITVSQSSNSNPDDGGSDGSSGGGGGGGGGGASAEPQSNVAAKELSKKSVKAGDRVRFEFPQGVTCIRYVEFDAKKSLGKVTTIVEMLKGQSKIVSDLPEGTVYKNVNIWVGSGGIANSNNIGNAVVGFRVEKDWLEKCGADKASVVLWNYNNKAWSKLETKVVGDDNTYVFFESKTPGFGPFTIVVPSKSTELKPSKETDTTTPSTEKTVSNPAADEEKPSDKSSIPGFESAIAVGVIGAMYQILRRR